MPSLIRLAAFLCGLLAIAIRLAGRFWVEPISWRIGPWPVGLALFAASWLLAFVVPLTIFGLIAWRIKSKTVPLHVDLRRRWFVAPGTPVLNGFWAIFLMALGGGAIVTERVPGQEALRIAHMPGAMAVSVATVLIFTAGGVVVLFGNAVRVVLDAEGVHIRQLWMSRRVRWEDLTGVERVRTGLNLWQRNSRRPLGVPMPFLRVDPDALTVAIRTYLQQPERRAAIGTLEELQRLLPPEPITQASQRS